MKGTRPSAEFLVKMARTSGRIAMEIFNDKDKHDTKWKADYTPFSAADTAVHDYIVDHMKTYYPAIPILGEEGMEGVIRPSGNNLWLIVDEIDGSNAFIQGVGTFVTMLALMRGAEPVASVVYDPVLRRAYVAELGSGAYCNGKRIRVAETLPKQPSIGIAAWPDQGKSDMLLSGMVEHVAVELHKRKYNFTNVGSIGYYDALVASGAFAATIFGGKARHDTAAGDLLVREAGGVAIDLHGKRLRYDLPFVAGHLFACQSVCAELEKLVRDDIERDSSRLKALVAA